MSHLLRSLFLLFSGLTVFLSGIANAHPGHGVSESGPVHYLSEPVHSVWLATALLVAVPVLAALFAGRRKGRLAARSETVSA